MFKLKACRRRRKKHNEARTTYYPEINLLLHRCDSELVVSVLRQQLQDK